MNDDVRENSVGSLSHFPTPDTVEHLLKMAHDPSAGVRKATMLALLDAGGEEALDALIAGITDLEPEVRSYAAMALGNIEDPGAIAPLIRTLDDESPEVRDSAMDALEGKGVIEPLARLLDDPEWRVRWKAGKVLLRHGDSRAIPVLERLQDDPNIPDGVQRSITSMLDKSA